MSGALPAAVMLDRDGTINVKAPPGEYLTRAEDLVLLPGAAEAIHMLNAAGVPVAVVTNQRGIALGRMTEGDLGHVHKRLRDLLAEAGARLDGIFHCPHEVDSCACRKPGTLLLERARDHLGLRSLESSVVIGDSLSDVLAGRAVGARTVLLCDDDPGGAVADQLADSLLAAVKPLLAQSDGSPQSDPPSMR
jgi:D-glycero-D-manno-heptose 1,7-bisphosphate phosphatase